MNRVTAPADTRDVPPPPDNYFVRLGAAPAAAPPAHRGGDRRDPFERGSSEVPRSRRRRKRVNGRTVLLSVLLVGLAAWFAWASGQPGGVSGAVDGFIAHVRGDVQDAATGPDLRNAVKFFDDQYAQNGSYPNPTEEQLTAAGVGIDVDVTSCGDQAVVLHTLTVSRLLVAGKDHGEVTGRYNCPKDLADPAPWK